LPLAVDVELFGQLLSDQPRRRVLEIPGPVTALDLAQKIGLDPSEIGFVAIDSVQSDLKDLVQPDSRICFFPYITGG
jgi:hypothetical protein